MRDLQRIERETFVRRVEWHDEIDSTNSRAMSLAQEDDVELPLLIGAARQTAGRGRGRNAWWSADGALTFSALINPLELGISAQRCPQVALITGLAVAETLETFLPSAVQLKWPNDVYVEGRKICGILTEAPAGRPDRLVVGIGLNVQNSVREAPSEIRELAVSLVDVLGERVPPWDEILVPLLNRWEEWLRRLGAEAIDFPTVWRPRCYLHGEQVTATIGPEAYTGVCLGLDADGVLLLQTEAGVRRILAGTVRRL
jgi:BirA family biotin operon repressor/biotin-[acetyl-CoA-carboxylase] ligase